MSASVKGCTNESCSAKKKRTVYREDERFCIRCGKPLSFVCKKCWTILENGNSEYCDKCQNRNKGWNFNFQDLEKHLHPQGQLVRISGTGSLLIPEEYERIRKRLPIDIDQSKEALAYGTGGSDFHGFIMCYRIEEEDAMPFGNVQADIDWLHHNMDDDTGIIEVAEGTTNAGRPYIYRITKHRLTGMQDIALGTEYRIYLNLRLEQGIANIYGSFTENRITGERDEDVLNHMAEQQTMDLFGGWSVDPYDPEFKKGYLMKQSERREYDVNYPAHPLTQVRSLISYICNKN